MFLARFPFIECDISFCNTSHIPFEIAICGADSSISIFDILMILNLIKNIRDERKKDKISTKLEVLREIFWLFDIDILFIEECSRYITSKHHPNQTISSFFYSFFDFFNFLDFFGFFRFFLYFSAAKFLEPSLLHFQ